ncbi:MAG TPA: dienelactone hydrolase family protein [Aggregatilineales bacterium]|nr:dienelactone hydrolase family protein [Aggregatilineales bacterium]
MVRPYADETAITGPHSGQPVLAAGEPLETARAAAVFVHGRGASAASILGLAAEFDAPGVAFLAPQAAGSTWYPNSFLAPLEANQPWLDSALEMVGAVLGRLEAAGFASSRVLLLGFSQGACLALEYAARNARRYGGVVGLSGGLIGPDGTPRDYAGSLDGTPVFLGCSDVDPHIPEPRVRHSADVLARLGADVDMRLYPGMGHTVNQDELNRVQEMLGALASG